MILVSAIEVGSVRSLLPVCTELLNQKFDIFVDKKGFFKEKECNYLDSLFVNLDYDDSSIKSFLISNSVKVLLFSVNINDTFPLKIARIAQSININTIHVLDYWNGYVSRMQLDGGKVFQPTKYLVPDEYAKKEAIVNGVRENDIVITGQPALSDNAEAFLQNNVSSNLGVEIAQNIKNKKTILFASEPVSLDQGESLEENKNFRGYVEKDALKVLIQSLKGINEEFYVIIVPHPRQNIQELKATWRLLGGDAYGDVLSGIRGRDLLPLVSGVSGMSSTLLYEAWLVGIPVLSIQPGLLIDSLRMMQKKDGVIFIDNYNSSVKVAKKWLGTINNKIKYIFQSDINLHINAPKSVVSEIISVYK